MEQLIQQLLMVLLTITPSEITADDLAKAVPPHIYVIPHEDLAQSVCGCKCELKGAYIGGNSHVLILSGIYDKENQNVLLPQDPITNTLAIHELQHYFQHLVYGDLFMEMKKEDKDINKEFRRKVETEAYEVSNAYAATHGLPPLDVHLMVEFSINAAGNPDCPAGETPVPIEQRLRMSDLIMFYNSNMVEHYTKTYNTVWAPHELDLMIECETHQ